MTAGTIPQTVPEWLEHHGRRNARGEWIATCPLCGSQVLGAYMREVNGTVGCTTCKARRRSRRGERP